MVNPRLSWLKAQPFVKALLALAPSQMNRVGLEPTRIIKSIV